MRSLIRRLTDHIAGWISSSVVATNDPGTSRKKLDTGYLHGLRAIAALWVLTFHVEFWSAWYRIPIPNGGLAVDLFMILSGFLMALLASQRWHFEPLNHPASWLEFYARRFFRIAPAYYISLLAAGVLAGPFFSGFVELSGRVPYLADYMQNGVVADYGLGNIALHLSFLFGLFPKSVSSTLLPDWSSSLEMQFYAAFPALFLLFRRFGASVAALALGAVCVPFIVYLSQSFPQPSLLFFKLPVFLIGMLLARAALVPDQRGRMTVAAFILLLTQFGFYNVQQVAWIALMIAAMTYLGLRPSGVLGRWLSNRPMRFLSDASYSVYLFHNFFIAIAGGLLFRTSAYEGLKPAARAGILWLVVICGSILVATLIRRVVEEPGIALGTILQAKLRNRYSLPSTGTDRTAVRQIHP